MSRATAGQSTKDTSSDTMGCTTPEYRKEDNEQGNDKEEQQEHQNRHHGDAATYWC
jgi:hypothetical protein